MAVVVGPLSHSSSRELDLLSSPPGEQSYLPPSIPPEDEVVLQFEKQSSSLQIVLQSTNGKCFTIEASPEIAARYNALKEKLQEKGKLTSLDLSNLAAILRKTTADGGEEDEEIEFSNSTDQEIRDLLAKLRIAVGLKVREERGIVSWKDFSDGRASQNAEKLSRTKNLSNPNPKGFAENVGEAGKKVSKFFSGKKREEKAAAEIFESLSEADPEFALSDKIKLTQRHYIAKSLSKEMHETLALREKALQRELRELPRNSDEQAKLLLSRITKIQKAKAQLDLKGEEGDRIALLFGAMTPTEDVQKKYQIALKITGKDKELAAEYATMGIEKRAEYAKACYKLGAAPKEEVPEALFVKLAHEIADGGDPQRVVEGRLFQNLFKDLAEEDRDFLKGKLHDEIPTLQEMYEKACEQGEIDTLVARFKEPDELAAKEGTMRSIGRAIHVCKTPQGVAKDLQKAVGEQMAAVEEQMSRLKKGVELSRSASSSVSLNLDNDVSENIDPFDDNALQGLFGESELSNDDASSRSSASSVSIAPDNDVPAGIDPLGGNAGAAHPSRAEEVLAAIHSEEDAQK